MTAVATALGPSHCDCGVRGVWQGAVLPACGARCAAPTAAACEDVAALRSSLEALPGVAETAIDNVKTSLDAAEASASPVLKPSVEQVKTAFAALQTAASGLTADNFKRRRRPSPRR